MVEKYLSEAEINNALLMEPMVRETQGGVRFTRRININPQIECIMREEFKRAVEYVFETISKRYGMSPEAMIDCKKEVLRGI